MLLSWGFQTQKGWLDMLGMIQSINKPAAQVADADPSYATSPIGKIHPFWKITKTLKPMINFDVRLNLEWA